MGGKWGRKSFFFFFLFTKRVSDPPTMLKPSPSLSLLTSMVVSLPGLTSQMVGSGSGSSGTLAIKLPPREDLECEDGPPCCRRTALPWWPPALPPMATPLYPPPPPEEAGTEPGVRPAATAGAVREADGRKEEEDEEAEREGKGSTGVAVAVAIVDVKESLTTATSSDVAEMAAIDGDGD